MSTMQPTPRPTSAEENPHLAGFNDHAQYDPFIPSSPDDEYLVPMNSDRSPSHYSYQSPSPPQAGHSDSSGLPPSLSFSNTYNHLQLPSQDPLANNFQPSYSNLDHEATNGIENFLSPNAHMSDTGYNASSEYTATPDFSGTNDVYLGDDYTMPVDYNQDMNSRNSNVSTNGHLPQTHNDTNSPHHSTYTRNSAGTATQSSVLMSPIQTDSGGPTSRHGTSSPPQKFNYIKSEEVENIPTAVFSQNLSSGSLDHTYGVQITPTLTESSKGTSPDLSTFAPDIARAASPVIRVDGYTRGDSPARGVGLLPRSGSKRSRAGSNASHLAVQQDDESDEEDVNDFSRRNDGFTQPVHVTVRTGLDPEQRSGIDNAEIPNLKEQDNEAQITLKNIDVKEWLDRSEHDSVDGVDAPPVRPALSRRQRAKSAGAQTLSQANLESFKTSVIDSHIPGPGVLINEESGDEEDEDEYEDGVASIEDSPPPTDTLDEPVNDKPGKAMPGVYDELPNQPPLFRAKLWQDPLHDSSNPGVKMQPETANDAIVRYQQRADNIETMSRVATWGTRRLSESDIHSLFHNLSFSEKPQEQAKTKRERRGSFLQQLSEKFVPKKGNGNLKRRDSDKSMNSKDKPERPAPTEHGRKDSSGSRKESLGTLGVPQSPASGLKRMSSLGKRPKSPRINTSSAVAAMAFQAGALGAGHSVSATATSSPTEWPKNRMRSVKNRNNLNGSVVQGPASASATDVGLAGLWSKQIGPPMPTLAAPLKTEDTLNGFGDGDDEEEDDEIDDHGVTMDLSIRTDTIIPTLEGFKSNIRQLNPRLPPYMFDRIAQEQLRRFKKLLDFKVKHVQALGMGKCASGKHCTALGGEPTYLPSKSNGKDPEPAHSGFTIAGIAHSDEEVNALAEGTVTAAQFPPGVPMPPVKRLPAEFECSLCFKVKKFQKPSDWSKHVHEDVQPFTCTFATCAEPKSFKRKADWVRHENERHRQLEWWMCNMNDCTHKCYRKDNFVQHLVREHKLPEPKVKTLKSGKPAVRGPSSQKARKHADDTEESNDEIDQVWRLVEECRHETAKNPREEACKFCGNVCNSWKKLTVHLAKHMEQISMPILGIVKEKEVTPETIISPIEQRIASQQPSMSPTVQSPFPQMGPTSSMPPYRLPANSTDELPGAFTPIQPPPNYLGAMAPEHQRVPSNTYPPAHLSQQFNAGYGNNTGTNAYISDYNSYTNASPATPFNPVNSNSRLQSGPENMYAPSMRAPTSQPQAAGYGNGNGMQYATQQQQAFSSPGEQTSYETYSSGPSSYFNQQTTSYPMQQQTATAAAAYPTQAASMGGQMPVSYNAMGPMQNYPRSMYDQRQQQQQQQQQQLYGYGQQ